MGTIGPNFDYDPQYADMHYIRTRRLWRSGVICLSNAEQVLVSERRTKADGSVYGWADPGNRLDEEIERQLHILTGTVMRPLRLVHVCVAPFSAGGSVFATVTVLAEELPAREESVVTSHNGD